MKALLLVFVLSTALYGQRFIFMSPGVSDSPPVVVVETPKDVPKRVAPKKVAPKPALVKRTEELIDRGNERVKILNTYAPPRRFDLGGYRKTKANLVAHLMGDIGQRGHAGLFNREQLQTLSVQQLDDLHSNTHDGRPFVVKLRKDMIPARPALARTICPT